MADITVPYFNLYKDSQGQWRWNLKARNHKTIADSAEGYFNRQDALHGIDLVKGETGVWDASSSEWL